MKDNRRGCRNTAMEALARARPSRLDPDAAQLANWPEPAQIVAAAERADYRPVDSAPGQRPPGRRSQPLIQSKLLGALTSAAVTATVIVIAVVVGALVLRAPHRHQPVGPSVSPVAPLAFHPLPLGPHWHGRVAFAISRGVVYLDGVARPDRPGGRSGPVATLPPSARPSGQLDLVAVLSTGDSAIMIGVDGQIQVARAPAQVTWVSLSGVEFPVGSR